MKRLTMILAMLMALTACTSSASHETQTAQQEQNSQTQQQSQPKQAGIWIDVRTFDEYQSGHLKGSLNIPVEMIADKIADIEPNKNAPIHLYCRSGNRAEVARQTLINMGYTHVVNHGGYDELIRQGYQ